MQLCTVFILAAWMHACGIYSMQSFIHEIDILRREQPRRKINGYVVFKYSSCKLSAGKSRGKSMYKYIKSTTVNRDCTIVQIGTPPTRFHASECAPPPPRNQSGRGHTHQGVRGWGIPSRTTGEKALYSAYSVTQPHRVFTHSKGRYLMTT
jgi:hypothetical protein